MMFPASVVQAKLIFHELGAILPWADSQEKQPWGPGGTLASALPALFITLVSFRFLQNQSLNPPWQKSYGSSCAAQLLKCWIFGQALSSAHIRYNPEK